MRWMLMVRGNCETGGEWEHSHCTGGSGVRGGVIRAGRQDSCVLFLAMSLENSFSFSVRQFPLPFFVCLDYELWARD